MEEFIMSTRFSKVKAAFLASVLAMTAGVLYAGGAKEQVKKSFYLYAVSFISYNKADDGADGISADGKRISGGYQ